MEKIEHEFKDVDIQGAFIDLIDCIYLTLDNDPSRIYLNKTDIEALANAIGYTMLKLPANKAKE